MGWGWGGRLFLYERRGNNGREAERNKAEEREAKRGRLVQTSSSGGGGGKRGTEDKRGGGKKRVASLYPDKVH